MTRPLRLLTGVFAAALALSAPTRAEADEASFATGNQAFRFTLGSLCGFRPLTSVEDLQADAKHTLLIITGDSRRLEQGSLWLHRFLKDDGSLLLATDRETPNVANITLGFGVAPARVRTFAPASQYKGNEDCPLVTFDAPRIFQGVVATNRPSYLRREYVPPEGIAHRFDFERVAFFPQFSRADFGGVGPFAVAHFGENQRLLILADHSVFINSMMLQDDNANMRFAYDCLRWLSENGRRTRVLYLDDGNIVRDFTVTPQEIPLPLPALPANLPVPAAEIANKIAAAWEDDNIHNQLLLDQFSRNQILRAAAVGLTAALLGYGAFRLWSARHSTEPGR